MRLFIKYFLSLGCYIYRKKMRILMRRLCYLCLLMLFPTLCLAQARGVPVIADEDLDFNISEDAFGNKLSPTVQQNKDISVDTSRSLSQNLKENANVEGDSSSKDSGGESWVKSLFKGGDKSDKVKDLMVEQKNTKPQRSNASVFDVAGVMLRMSFKQAETELLKRGYKKITQKMDVPNFIRWRNEEKCRNQGVVGYERLESCIIKLAQKDNHYYISQASFNKFDTKETVEIFLSSTFTNNKVYKVTYQTEAAGVKGNGTKAVYLRNLKVYDFWKKINQKYGNPDDEEDAIWGLGDNRPYLKASTGYLRLEDPLLQALDVNRMSREDQKFIHTDNYTF